MSIYDSNLWLSDLDEIINELPELRELAGKSILITGSTGLICSAVVDVLIRWNNTHDEHTVIYAAGRNKEKLLERFHPLSKKTWFHFVPYDATAENLNFEFRCDYIIHGASNATPHMITKEPVETMVSNFVGLRGLLEYAKERSVNRVLYISSSEVYGLKEGNKPYKSDEYGYIDLLKSRNSYSVAKRAAETLCVSYTDEYGLDSVIVRPGHIYGPTASKSDNRVSSMWAYDAAEGKDIIMKSSGAQMRSYCYCLDCASAIIKVLLNGEPSHAYNISNPESVITIRQMAEVLAKAAGVELKIQMPTDEESKGFNPMRNSSLDSEELLTLGWEGTFDARRGFTHTIEIIRSLM